MKANKIVVNTHHQKLKKMYLAANVNRQLFETTACRISEGEAEISLEISEKYFHALGAIHGAVYFKLLDDAAFFAVNSLVEDFFVLTTSFHINIVRPVNKGRIKAVGKVKFRSQTLYVAEATLYDQDGKEVAFGTGNFTKSRVRLSEDVGYKR